MITADEVAASLKLPPERLAEAQALATMVIAQLETETSRKFALRADFVEELINTHPTCEVVFLSLKPISAISLVETKERSDDWEELAAEDYFLSGRGLHKVSGVWPSFVRVTYDGGYDETTCPADLKFALLTQCKFLFNRLTADKIDVSSKQLKDTTVQYITSALHPVFDKQVKIRKRR